MGSYINRPNNISTPYPAMNNQQMQDVLEGGEDNVGTIMGNKMSAGVMFVLITQIFMGGWWAASATGELKALRDKLDAQGLDRYTKSEATLQNASADRRLSSLEEISIDQAERLRQIELTVREIAAYTKK